MILSLILVKLGGKSRSTFFAARANGVTVNTFLEQLFYLSVNLDFLQEQQDLLEHVMQEGPKEEFKGLDSKAA